MYKKAFKFLLIAAVLWGVLVGLIYLGSYLRYTAGNQTWHGTGTIITLLFIWATIFTVTVVITMKGIELIKQNLRGKLRLDFAAWLGVLVAEYSANESMDIVTFFNKICQENGVKEAPKLAKFYDNNKKLAGTREAVFDHLRKEIEFLADKHSAQVQSAKKSARQVNNKKQK